VPVDQEGVGKEGMKTVIDHLHCGQAVVVFPEGSRTPDGIMHDLRPGIHLIIKRTRCAVVPVGIAGAYDAWPIWRNYPIIAPLFMPPARGNIAVVVGQPIASDRLAMRERDQTVAELFVEIQKVQTLAEQLRRR
jgi:1-acyl-sn-glycerol-3-phosphate acyltransferase